MTRDSLPSPGYAAAQTPSAPRPHFLSRWWPRIGLIFAIFTLVGVLEAGQSIMMQLVSNKSPSGWRALLLGVADWYMWAALTPFVLWASQLYPIEQRDWP